MPEIEREPCPDCGEPAALAGRVCPHCQGSLLVEIATRRPAAGSRERYRAARALLALGLGGTGLSAAQAALGQTGAVVLSGVTRADARRARATLSEHGIEVDERPLGREPTRAASAGRLRPARLAAAGAAVLAAAAALWLGWPRPSAEAPRASGDAAPAARPAAAQPALQTREIADRAIASTVSLRCEDRVGAGFFVAAETALTNAHVLCPGSDLIQAVFQDGRELAGSVVARDEWLDLAAVRVLGARAEPLPLGDATVLGTGDRVVMIGSPRGLDFTVHEGIVSNAARNSLGVAFIQIDANINPGNSGGPLLDDRGRVVGVVSAMVASSSGLGLVLPVNYSYAGEGALLGAERPEWRQQAWEELLAEVAEADRREVAELEQALARPPGGLIAASVAPNGAVVAAIARRWTGLPEVSNATFAVHQEGAQQCGRTYPMDRWRPVTGEDLGMEGRQVLWMERHGLTAGLHVSSVRLDFLRSCRGLDRRSPFEIRLADAAPLASSVRLGPLAAPP